jgi:hypothetical protein
MEISKGVIVLLKDLNPFYPLTLKNKKGWKDDIAHLFLFKMLGILEFLQVGTLFVKSDSERVGF